MGLDATQLAALDDLLGALPAGGSVAAIVRAVLPAVSCTLVDERDLADAPVFRDYPHYRVYLVDGQNHCWQLTRAPETATGIVLARRNGP